MNLTITITGQLYHDSGPAALHNTLTVPAEDAEHMLGAWSWNVLVMKQPGKVA